MSLQTLRDESKKTVRRPVGKVRITWTDPLIDNSIQAITSEENRISYPTQVADLVNIVPRKWAHTNDTDVRLDGTWYPMPSTLQRARSNQVGWWGKFACDSNGDWAPGSYPTLTVDFAKRLVEGYLVTGDSALNEFPVDFTIELQQPLMGGYVTLETINITGNTALTYTGAFSKTYNSATRTVLTVKKWNTPEKVVKIVEFYTSITEEFYDDDIVYMNILQEFEDTDGTLPVGNISCNELDLSLQNIDDRFFPGNTSSDIYTFIKRNRRIEAFLGFQYDNGTIEYLQKGLYWSGDWSVSDLGTVAQTSARDRFEIMRKTDFPTSTVFPDVLQDVTLKELLDTVLVSFRDYMTDFFYDISDMDGSYIVDVFLPEFFEKKSYFDVVKMISAAALSYTYMDEPTDAEKSLNGGLMRDVMRLKRLSTVFPDNPVRSQAEELTKDDFINKIQPSNTEEIANVINVTYYQYTYVEDPGEWEETELASTSTDEQSIREYGQLSYNYDENKLIQQESHAQQIGDILVSSFSVTRKDIEVEAFGDITLKLADKIIVPDYQKYGINNKGTFAIKRLNATYDGSLRMTIEGRKLQEYPDEGDTITETPGAGDTITEDLNNVDTITEVMQ